MKLFTPFLFALAALPTQASAAPIPLHFPPGTYGVMVSGQLTMSVTNREYALDLAAGQQVIVTFAGGGLLKGGINCEGGGDGPWDGTGSTFTVPKTGRCIVYLGQNQMAEPWAGGFTLSVLAVTVR